MVAFVGSVEMSNRLKNYRVYIGNRSFEDCYKVKAKDVDEVMAAQPYIAIFITFNKDPLVLIAAVGYGGNIWLKR